MNADHAEAEGKTKDEKPNRRQVPIYENQPGRRFQMRDHARYHVSENGEIRSDDPPKLTKKERNKLKRKSR